jgi:hypothetical protein
VFGDKLLRQPTPAKAGQEKLDPARQIHEPPSSCPENAIAWAFASQTVGQDQLNMLLEISYRDRTVHRRERMACCHDRSEVYLKKRYGRDVLRNDWQQDAKG